MSRMRVAVGVALILALAGIAPAAFAHKASDSYLALRITSGGIEGQWDIALRDLEVAIGIDTDGDGEITWGELKARQAAVDAYALSRLTLRSADADCPAKALGHLVDEHTDGTYAVLRFEAICPRPVEALTIDYRLLFDIDPQHRGLLRLEHSSATRTGILSPEASTQTLSIEAITWRDELLQYAREGVWHIWMGFDHILFLVSLLLPAVVVSVRRPLGLADHAPVAAFRPAFWDVVRIVTSFTLAHSITLSLATLGVVSLPSRWVESAIALSVMLAAANNVFPLVERRRWVVAFVFGLVHGFGFASVLADLGLPRATLVTALVGFNLGVEIGQLAIVAVFVPIAYRLRASAFYRHVVLTGGSILIFLLAGIWLAERALDLRILG